MIKGLGNVKKALEKSVTILKMKSGESKTIRILVPADEIMATYEHTKQINGFWKTIACPGKGDCPLCQAGDVASFKAYIPVLDRTDGKVKIFKANKKTVVYIIGLVEEYGDLTTRDFKLSRVGDGLDTTYQMFPRDPQPEDFSSLELPDIESMVTPMTRDAILDILNNPFAGAPAEGTGDDDMPF